MRLVCTCDLAVSVETDLFGTPEARVGVAPVVILPPLLLVVPRPWVARWRDDQGKQRYRVLRLPLGAPEKVYDDAAALARAWFKQATAGVLAQRTVKDAADRYVKALRLRRGEAAAKDAQGRIDRTVLPKLGDRPLDRLTTADLEEWLHGLVPAGKGEDETRRAKESANRNLITLKALLNNAWRTGLVASNSPWRKVSAFAKTTRARDVFLTPEQRKRLLDHCAGAFRNLVQVALLTGALR